MRAAIRPAPRFRTAARASAAAQFAFAAALFACAGAARAQDAAVPDPAAPAATDATPDEPLPSGAVATIDGEPVRERAFHAFVGRERRHDRRAADVLEFLVSRVLIERDARERGLAVTTDEVAAMYARYDELSVRESGKSLRDVLEARGVDVEEFKATLPNGILLQRLARADFGVPAGEDVPDEKTSLWLQDRLARAEIVRDGLAPDVVAAADGVEITEEMLGRAIVTTAPRRTRMDLLDEYLGVLLIEREAARRGAVLSDAAVERMFAHVRERIAKGSGGDDVPLDEALERTGTSRERLLASPLFRAKAMLDQLATEAYGDEELRRYFDEHRAEFDARHGDELQLACILLRAGSEAAVAVGFSPRTFEQAEEQLREVRASIESGAEDFAAAARRASEHGTAARGGDVGFRRAADAEFGAFVAEALLADDRGETLVGPLRSASHAALVSIGERRRGPGFEELRSEVEQAAHEAFFRALLENASIRRRG